MFVVRSLVGSGDVRPFGVEFRRSHSALAHVPADIPANAIRVYLPNNLISIIAVGAFTNLSICTLLDLNENHIHVIENGSFTGLDQLRMLKLHQNKLTSLHPDMWTGLPSLTWLDLGGNGIGTISSACFDKLPNLEWLYLSKNNLTLINEDMWTGLESLLILRLDENKINTIPDAVFSSLGELRTLRLDTNLLTTIRASMWEGLSSLTKLHLSDNRIFTIESRSFTTLPQLSDLWLHGNELVTLNESAFNQFNLTLSLYGNPLECDRHLCWLKEREHKGWLRWHVEVKLPELTFVAHRPYCANAPNTEWDRIVFNCSLKGKNKMAIMCLPPVYPFCRKVMFSVVSVYSHYITGWGTLSLWFHCTDCQLYIVMGRTPLWSPSRLLVVVSIQARSCLSTERISCFDLFEDVFIQCHIFCV